MISINRGQGLIWASRRKKKGGAKVFAPPMLIPPVGKEYKSSECVYSSEFWPSRPVAACPSCESRQRHESYRTADAKLRSGHRTP